MRRLGDFEVEVNQAEREKYAAPLLLLHGLWTGPPLWLNFRGYLSHRGWSSYAPDLRSAGMLGWGDLLDAVRSLAAEMPAPPIVVGHDLGALLALYLTGKIRAAVALAPLPVGADVWGHPVLGGWRARGARSLGRSVRPSRRQATALLGVDSGSLIPERARWVDELAALRLPAATAHTCLLMAGGRDRCISQAQVRRIARECHADLQVYPEAGHGLPLGPEWDTVVNDIHRWMIRVGGEDLMLLRGDEDLRDE